MEEMSDEVKEFRKPSHAIGSIFVNRWSPRSMTGESLSDEELLSLFEAARWAPSSFNGQPWRFIYAKRGSSHWETFFNLLVEGNQAWAKQAAALVVVVSRKNFEHKEKPSQTHSYDTGAAWENLALEGARRGLVVHGMEGFDYEKAREVLEIPEVFQVEAMIVIGKRGSKESLPEKLQEMEKPSERKPLKEIVFEGKFGSP